MKTKPAVTSCNFLSKLLLKTYCNILKRRKSVTEQYSTFENRKYFIFSLEISVQLNVIPGQRAFIVVAI